MNKTEVIFKEMYKIYVKMLEKTDGRQGEVVVFEGMQLGEVVNKFKEQITKLKIDENVGMQCV